MAGYSEVVFDIVGLIVSMTRLVRAGRVMVSWFSRALEESGRPRLSGRQEIHRFESCAPD